MKVAHEHIKHYHDNPGIKLSSDTLEHLMHLATTPFAKKVISEEHLIPLIKNGHVREALGGHCITDKGHMKLLYEGV